MAGRSVNGFVYFRRNESKSAAAPRPGITEKHMHIIVEQTLSRCSTYQPKLTDKKPDGFPINNVGNDGVKS